MNDAGRSGPPLPRLGPAPTRSRGYPEPASLAPAPPPGYPPAAGVGASRREWCNGARFGACIVTASRSRLARGPSGLGAVPRTSVCQRISTSGHELNADSWKPPRYLTVKADVGQEEIGRALLFTAKQSVGGARYRRSRSFHDKAPRHKDTLEASDCRNRPKWKG